MVRIGGPWTVGPGTQSEPGVDPRARASSCVESFGSIHFVFDGTLFTLVRLRVTDFVNKVCNLY